MTLAAFHVPGPVVGKMRARHASRGAFVRTYTPDKQVAYETHVRACALAVWSGTPLDQPLAVSLDIAVAVPASWSKKKQAAALAGELLPTGKPDLDNTQKSIFDALNGIVWRDDSIIARVSAAKRYGPAPGVSVRVEPA